MGQVVRSRRVIGLAGVVAALVVSPILGGCSLHQAGVEPPDNRIFFPSGGVVDPDGRWLYVVNSNSDLRYNAGTVVAVDLDNVKADDPRSAAFDPARGRWEPCSNDPRYVPEADAPHVCCWDHVDPTILNCDEQAHIKREWSVRIGSFAGAPAIQKFVERNDMFDPKDAAKGPEFTESFGLNRRLFVPVRGDGSITMMNLANNAAPAEATKFTCTGDRLGANVLMPPVGRAPQEPFARCEDTWRITRKDDPLVNPVFKDIPDDQVLRLPPEPYALAIDDPSHLLFVGHLQGAVSLIDLGLADAIGDRDTGKPQVPNLIDRNTGVLPGDSRGATGVTSLTIRPSDSCGKEVFATSRFAPLSRSFVTYGLHGARCGAASDGSESDEGLVIIPTGASYATGLSGSDTRGIEFVNSSYAHSAPSDPVQYDRVFLIQRFPPTLVGIDTATQLPLSTMEICQGPTNMTQPRNQDGQPLFGIPLLSITCYDSGELYVVDPSGPRIQSVIPLGREPITTVFDSTDPTRAYVIGFGGNNVSVVDLDPSSPTHDRVIQRIGYPSAVPRPVGAK